LWKNESQAPLQLRELEIYAPLSNIPKSIGKLKHLERIVIEGKVNLTQLPKEFCLLQSLKALVLVGFSEMKSLQECFFNLTNLQQIDLSSCRALERLPESLGNLTNLQQIKLSNCRALERLPESLGNLTNLQQLTLSDCRALERLPESLGNLTNLQQIKLTGPSALERLPDSFCKLIKLQNLDLSYCTNLTMSSETLGNISTLERIDLTYCGKIEVLPQQVTHQRSLKELRMQSTNIKELPSAIGELSNLEVMTVGPLLDTPPPSLWDLKNLKELELYECKELKCLPPSLRLWTQLTKLTLEDCPLVRELPFKEEVKGKRETLSDLDSSIHILPRLQELWLYKTGISEISFAEGVCCNLRYLTIYGCNDLVEVGTLPNTLIWLSFLNCSNLRKIDQIYGLAKLQMLDLSGCTELEEVEGIQHCMALDTLYAEECPKLQWSAGVVKQLCRQVSDLQIERGFIHYLKGCLHFPH
jgi:Leucine-rich repeat (LRR) protein